MSVCPFLGPLSDNPLHNRNLLLRQAIELVHQVVDLAVGGLDLVGVRLALRGTRPHQLNADRYLKTSPLANHSFDYSGGGTQRAEKATHFCPDYPELLEKGSPRPPHTGELISEALHRVHQLLQFFQPP